MLPASNRGAGENFGFPDTCLTPVGPAVVPIPYPNVGLNAQAAEFSPNVSLCAMPALNMGSVIPMTFGDEPGVANPTIKGASTFTTGNPKVFINGLPAIDLTSSATGNNMNEGAGMQAMPSATNVFYTYATAAELCELDASLPRDGSAVTGALLPGGVGCLRVAMFSADVPARVHTAIRRLEAAGAGALVIDLRGNPGGELTAALQLASDFVEDETLLLTMRDEAGDETALRARGGALYGMPLCLLVDRGTASAAELFAGCLQAHGRAVVAGERTYSKGAGHALVRGPDGALRVTQALFSLPGGVRVEGAGLTPDVALLATEHAIADAAELLQHVR